jgi:L-ascorbate metabolism protein UlaG (beta-lactamase superfamily)
VDGVPEPGAVQQVLDRAGGQRLLTTPLTASAAGSSALACSSLPVSTDHHMRTSWTGTSTGRSSWPCPPAGVPSGGSARYDSGMRITRFGHSCLLVEDGDARLLLDPGVFSAGFEDPRPDRRARHAPARRPPRHRAPDRPARAQPDARLHVDEGSAHAQVPDLPHTVVRDGDVLDLGTTVEVVGSQHAVIHPDIPRIPNVGYLVGERFFTPGDAMTVPEADVEVLGLPTGAPWLKLSEGVELLRAVRPRVAFPVHDAVLATPQIWYGQYAQLAAEGTDYRVVAADEAVPL